jgi:hypothetical protein
LAGFSCMACCPLSAAGADHGKVTVSKSYAERDPALVALAREIKGHGGRVSLRQVAAELASKGFTTPSGVPYSASAVASMLNWPAPSDAPPAA